MLQMRLPRNPVKASRFVARRPCTIFGYDFEPGDEVPMHLWRRMPDRLLHEAWIKRLKVLAWEV